MKRKRRIFLLLGYVLIFFQLIAYYQAVGMDVTEGETGTYLIAFYMGYSIWLIAATVLIYKAYKLKRKIREELHKSSIESIGKE